MSPEAEFIRSEISDIEQIIRDECWLEGERRGGPVDSKEAIIQARVADIILAGAGSRLRQEHSRHGESATEYR